MTTVNIDDEIYKQISEYIKMDKIEYPTIQNFVEKSCRDKLRIETINKKEVLQWNGKRSLKAKRF